MSNQNPYLTGMSFHQSPDFKLSDIPLVRLLCEERRRANGQLNTLKNDINSCSSHGALISTNLLSKLTGNEDSLHEVRLSFRHFQRLYDYFESKNCGWVANRPLLPDVTSVVQLLQRLQITDGLTKIIGARPRVDGGAKQGDSAVRLWDMLALEHVEELVSGRFTPLGETATSTFMHCSSGGKANPKWRTVIEQKQGAVVTIGSPRACMASEELLARMCGIEAYRPIEADRSSVPFLFIYPSGGSAARQSSFSVAESLLPSGPGSKRLLIVGNKQLDSNSAKNGKQRHYGLVAIQRKIGDGGQQDFLRLVLAGVTGPGTLLAAKMLPQLRLDPAQLEGDRILFAVASCDLDPSDEDWETGDVVKVPEMADWVIKPRLWRREVK